MEEVKSLQKKYCSQTMILAICVAMVFIFSGYKAIGKGFLLASIFSIINFSLIARLNPLLLGKSRFKSTGVALISIILRYGILSIPLIISIKNASIDFIAVAVGLFAVQLVILFNHLVIDRFLTRKAGC